MIQIGRNNSIKLTSLNLCRESIGYFEKRVLKEKQLDLLLVNK